MAQTRHLIIDTSKTPNVVVDKITFETDPESPNYERLCATDGFHVVASDIGDVGWTWSENDGLKAP
ncbi:hypothetical protein FPV16_14880 [Methylobacterium sp. W2]|uniref:hypothetical protein n=1 Tax=Methylobacterium sp. W2 TaxID=2598107 RepID=UPI001D0C0442|nr:hypothetical protein [Methylobacterium sp. W2]MCC0807498.1 hypothetical protein [Methylobacterium sp. W2]